MSDDRARAAAYWAEAIIIFTICAAFVSCHAIDRIYPKPAAEQTKQ